jgi:hypothetical protein
METTVINYKMCEGHHPKYAITLIQHHVAPSIRKGKGTYKPFSEQVLHAHKIVQCSTQRQSMDDAPGTLPCITPGPVLRYAKDLCLGWPEQHKGDHIEQRGDGLIVSYVCSTAHVS